MNRTRMLLALATAAWFALSAAAAPAPAPPSDGPLSDALRLRDKAPKTPPPRVNRAAMPEAGVIELDAIVSVPVTEEVVEKVAGSDGKVVEVRRVVTKTIAETRTEQIKADGCKFFLVTKDGTLDPLDAAKAAGMLKKRTAVLVGSADVDPRNLELVKPGTIYIAFPEPQVPPIPLPDESRHH